jgi:predicted deacylase
MLLKLKNGKILITCAITIALMVSTAVPVLAETYRPHSQQINMFKALCDQYSQASYEVIGETYEGRDIIICKFGNPNNPAVLWDGSLHGWEDMGTETMYYLAEWLLSSSDSMASNIRQNNYVLFIPVVNVDSEVRENRNFESCSNGVDLNRNFKKGWSYSSCGTYPNTFHGDSAASEPETQAVRAAMNKFRPKFYMNIHVGGEYLRVDGSADRQMANDFMSLYSKYSSSMGVKHYSTSSSGAGNGMAYGDAAEFGGIGILFEMYTASSWSDKPSQSTLENTYMPRLKAILVAMCEACEGDSPSPPAEEPEPTPEEPSSSSGTEPSSSPSAPSTDSKESSTSSSETNKDNNYDSFGSYSSRYEYDSWSYRYYSSRYRYYSSRSRYYSSRSRYD